MFLLDNLTLPKVGLDGGRGEKAEACWIPCRGRQLVRVGYKGEELIRGHSFGEEVRILGRFSFHRGMSDQHYACM